MRFDDDDLDDLEPPHAPGGPGGAAMAARPSLDRMRLEQGAPTLDPYGSRPMPTPALRVVGGQGQPTKRPDLLAAVRHWHKGMRNRNSGELEPWKTLVLTHLESGRPIRQWDLRTDESDDDLAAEVEMVLDAHGRPLAGSSGTSQTYQLDAYFGDSTMPSSNWTGSVTAAANLDSFGQPHLQRRGTFQDFEQQRFRHNEMQMQASFGLTRFNVELLVQQNNELRAELQWYRSQLHAVEERERALADREHQRRIDIMREEASIKRRDYLIAKLMRYVPIIAAKLDERLFGLAQLTPDDKERKATEIVRMLLAKAQEGEGGGIEKLNALMEMLKLSEKEQEKIQEVGMLFWLEEERRKLHVEAQIAAAGGGFLGLGEEVAKMGETPGETKPAALATRQGQGVR